MTKIFFKHEIAAAFFSGLAKKDYSLSLVPKKVLGIQLYLVNFKPLNLKRNENKNKNTKR